jgi:hypothetical protein
VEEELYSAQRKPSQSLPHLLGLNPPTLLSDLFGIPSKECIV